MKKLYKVSLLLSCLIFPLFVQAKDTFTQINLSIVNITKEMMPSIVHLRIKRHAKLSHLKGGMDRGLYNDLFGDSLKRPKPQQTEMVGSGVIVGEGYIITNHHVIADADEINIIFHNNEELIGTLVGTDVYSDIAVIKFNTKKTSYKIAKLGDSNKLKVGEIVLALGSPFGLRESVTQGIVSAKGRKNGFGVGFIQTDAAINPGNSGGALVNLRGEVIGINGMIISRSISPQTAGFQGIALAIPINLVKKVIKQIIANGRVIRGFLGIRPANSNELISKGLRIKRGVLINMIVPNSPADKGGLKPWDLITKVDRVNIKDFNHLRETISDIKIGEKVTITFIRKTKNVITKIVIADLDKFIGNKVKEKVKPKKKVKVNYDDPSIGLKVKTLTKEDIKILSKEFKVNYGVIVLKVKEHSVGLKSGIKPGDIILEIEGEPIKNPALFNSHILKYRKTHFLRMRVIKKGQLIILPVIL